MKIRCKRCFSEYESDWGMCPYCGYAEGDRQKEPFCLALGAQVVRRYVIGDRLGMDSFGITYKAWDKKTGAILAVKEYYPSGLVNRLPGQAAVQLTAANREREFLQGKTRFLEEARNLAQFNAHPNIIHVSDFFEANNTAYMVTEYLEGRTLAETVQKQNAPLPYDYCVRIALDVCGALEALHRANVLHRDINPESIMLCANGTTKLFDFGAARFAAAQDNRGTAAARPGFTPPEQYEKANRPDPRSDIYALGATLYYAVTGQKPGEAAGRKGAGSTVEPSKLVPGVPQDISTAIMRAMAVEPKYRFPDAASFAAALRGEKKVAPVKKERSRRRRRWILAILIPLLILLLAAGGVLFYLHQQGSLDWEFGSGSDPDAGPSETELEVQVAEAGDKAALESIAASFSEEHEEASLEVRTFGGLENIPQGSAEAAAVFAVESLEGADEEMLLSLDDLLSDLEDDSFADLSGLGEFQYPTGAVCPLIYMNTALGSLGEVNTLSGLVEQCQAVRQYFTVSPEALGMYVSLLGEETAAYAAPEAKAEFLSGEAMAYLGSTMDYFEIQDAMPGAYSVQVPASGAASYVLTGMWSANQAEDGASELAQDFLRYLNGPEVQDVLHIQGKSGQIPLQSDALSGYFKAYPELEVLSGYLEQSYAAPAENAADLMEGADHAPLAALREAKYFVTFADVPEGKWYTEPIGTVCGHGLMDGVTDTQFYPDGSAVKADVIVALYRMAGSPETAGTLPFMDVNAASEEGQAVTWALSCGLVSANNTGLFNGGASIDLQTTLSIFYRYAGQMGMDQGYTTSLNRYADGASVGGWAADSVLWAIDKGVITVNDGGNIGPRSEVSRARLAALLERMMALES